jgi:hypothetical protein
MPTRNTPTVVRIDRRFLTLSASFAESSELKAEGVLSEDVSFGARTCSRMCLNIMRTFPSNLALEILFLFTFAYIHFNFLGYYSAVWCVDIRISEEHATF